MLEAAPPFPDEIPDGYQLLEDELEYDAIRHVDLGWPEKIWTLEEFGYSQDEIDSCASPLRSLRRFDCFRKKVSIPCTRSPPG